MKRIALVLVAALALVFGTRALLRAMRSDEECVRDLLREEQTAFDEGSMFATMQHFADDFVDASGLTRAQVHGAILWAMQNRRGPDGSFRYAVRLPVDEIEVLVDGDVATAAFELELLDESAPAAALWRVHVDAEFARREGTWRIVRSKHATTGGKRPF